MALPAYGLKSLVFCSSAGHCQLDCAYCVASPVVKREPSLTYEDIRFLLGELEPPVGLYFSGRGDFFAGYAKRDRFLDRVLDHDVLVGLDVNGVLLNEYPEISPEKLSKVRDVNLTLHWVQVREKRVEKAWAANARTLVRLNAGSLLLGTIVSPGMADTWEEALSFYRRSVFEETGQRIWLIRDTNRDLSPAEEERLQELRERHADLVEKEHRDDFASPFTGVAEVLCPAGRNYFRVWNDGRVDACMWVDGLGAVGNVKERRLERRGEPFRCGTARFCDCWIIHNAGLMGGLPAAGGPAGG